MKNRIFLIACVLFFLAFAQNNLIYSQIITQETFDELPGSTSGTMTDGSTWMALTPGECDGNTGIFAVNNGNFEIQDIEGFNCCSCGGGPGGGNCGDNQNIILFEDIDISGVCGNIRIVSNWLSEGNMECEPGGPFTTCEGGHDQLVGEYSVDNGPFIQFGYFCGNTLVQNAETGFVISGNTLDIRFSGGNQASSEKYSIVDVIVESDGSGTGPDFGFINTGAMCPGDCVDIAYMIEDGVAPYDVVLEFSSGGFSLTEAIFDVPANGSVTVCYEPEDLIPSYDPATNTLTMTDDFGTTLNIEVLSVADDTGCSTFFTNGSSVLLALNDPPSINTIDPIEICLTPPSGEDIDLSVYDLDIGAGNTVTYYSDPGLTIEIGPVITVNTDITIYATTSDLGCDSESIEIQIQVQDIPVIDNPGPIQECGQYTLPTITGTDLTSSVSYWTGPGQTGASLNEGVILSDDITIYIYDEGNGCPAEEVLVIDIIEQPDVFDVPSVEICHSYELPEIQGDNLSGNETYTDQPNGAGFTYNPGDIITEDLVLYIYDEIGNCSDQAVLIIDIDTGPMIIMPDTILVCDSFPLPNINGEGVSVNAAYYDEPGGEGTPYPDDYVVTSTQSFYMYDGNSACYDEKYITFNVIVGPEFVPQNDTIVCDYYVFPEFEGTNLYLPLGIGINASVTFVPGDTLFESEYVVWWDTIHNFGVNCHTSAMYSVTVESGLQAGPDVDFNDCGGSTINVEDLLSSQADLGGTFIDTSTVGALTGNQLDASLIQGDQFTFYYRVENSCGVDTAEFNLTITDNAYAGFNTSSSVCSDEELTLFDFTSDGDPGGVFVNTTDGSEVTDLNGSDVVDAGGSLLLYYIVGQGGTCDPDTADINFVVTTAPVLDLAEDIELCTVYELPDILGTDLSGTEVYNTEIDGSGTVYEVGDTLFSSDVLYVQSGSGACTTVDSIDVMISIPLPTLIEETICNDDTLTVNGEKFWFENPTGTQVFTTDSGCDSIVEIQLDFFVQDTNFINEEVCYGGVFEIFGITLDADNPNVQIVTPFADQNNCDSVIVVNLTFAEPLTRDINNSLCPNDSLLVNGVYYSIDNPSGIDTVKVPNNCDTILYINLTFDDDITTNIDDNLCPDEEIVVNGQVYNMDNPTGTETITGPGGCDSIVNINLSFFDPAEGMITGSFCVNDVIDTLGETFDINNPEMEVVLAGASAQNCDSIVFVSFSFDQFDEGMLDTTVCEAIDVILGNQVFNSDNPTGQVTLQNIDGCDSIVNVTYNLEEVEVDISVVDASCDQEFGFIVFNSLSENGAEYFYMLDGGTVTGIEIGDTIFNISPGEHNITFSTESSCNSSDDFIIEMSEELSLTIPTEVTINEGDSYEIGLQGFDNAVILWTPPTGLSCFDCINPTFTPEETTEYVVTVTDAAGCFVTDTILIRVEESFDIYIPNVITPNDDGINDVFTIFSESDIPYDLTIYDRWGNRVYEELNLTTNSTQGWEGMFNSKTVAQGVYVYKALLYLEDNTVPELRTGTITVVR